MGEDWLSPPFYGEVICIEKLQRLECYAGRDHPLDGERRPDH